MCENLTKLHEPGAQRSSVCPLPSRSTATRPITGDSPPRGSRSCSQAWSSTRNVLAWQPTRRGISNRSTTSHSGWS
jgi:hypothetical protein